MKSKFLKFVSIFIILLLISQSVSAAITTEFISQFGDDALSDPISPLDTAFDRATNTLYALDEDGVVYLFDDEGFEIDSFSAVSNPGTEDIRGIAVHPVSKNIYVTSSDGVVKIYQPDGTFVDDYGAGVFVGDPDKIAVDVNGSYVASDADDKVYFFDEDNAIVADEDLTDAFRVEVEDNIVYVVPVDPSSVIYKYQNDGTFLQSIDLAVTYGFGFGIVAFAVYNDGKFATAKNSRDDTQVIVLNADGTSNFDYFGDEVTLNAIRTLEVTTDEKIYVGDLYSSEGRISVFDPGEGLYVFGIPADPIPRLSSPVSIGIGSNGNVYVLDQNLNAVKVYSSSGAYISTFGSFGVGDGQLSGPKSLALDSSDYIYIADTGNGRIEVFNSSGVYQRQWAVTEAGSYGGPNAITIYNDQVYVTGGQGDDQLVQVFSLFGAPAFTFGGIGEAPGQFSDTSFITHDVDGNIYVSESGTGEIHKFSSVGVYIETITNYLLDLVPTTFINMTGVALDQNKNIFISDNDSSRIVILNEAGDYITEFGVNGNGEGEFNSMGALALVDTTLYIEDNVPRVQIFSYVDDVDYDEPEPTPRRRSISSKPLVWPHAVVTPIQEVCQAVPFDKNLKRGMSGPEVARIQDFLREQKVYLGPTTGYFGRLTQAGVSRFQSLHQAYILKPLGLSRPTGNWHIYTRSFANTLIKCN